jgi:hypothetical protein
MVVRHRNNNNICFHFRKTKMKTNKWNREKRKFLFFFKETIDDDETDRNEENDDNTNEKNDLRISQPKYSQLLKELDFSQARMVNRKCHFFFIVLFSILLRLM